MKCRKTLDNKFICLDIITEYQYEAINRGI